MFTTNAFEIIGHMNEGKNGWQLKGTEHIQAFGNTGCV
jgi:hypothetical protein